MQKGVERAYLRDNDSCILPQVIPPVLENVDWKMNVTTPAIASASHCGSIMTTSRSLGMLCHTIIPVSWSNVVISCALVSSIPKKSY